jgi:hypothetical protein
LIVAYVKAFDPTSVVKETEAETAAAMGSLMERAKAKYSAMAGDGRLTPEQRADLFKQIEMKAKTAAARQDKIDEQFLGLAKRRQVDPQDLRFAPRPAFEDLASGNGTKPDSGTALAAPKGGAQLPPLSDIEKELERRGVKTRGASGGY